MELPEVVGQVYESGSQVSLDGFAYRDCKFKTGCHLIYRGGPTRVEGCAFEDGVALDLQQNAMFVLKLFYDLGIKVTFPRPHWGPR